MMISIWYHHYWMKIITLEGEMNRVFDCVSAGFDRSNQTLLVIQNKKYWLLHFILIHYQVYNWNILCRRVYLNSLSPGFYSVSLRLSDCWPWMVTIRIRQEATFIFLGVWKTTWGPLCVSTSAILDWSCSCSQSWLTTKTEQPMTEVDSQCLRRGTTRMPHEILKQLLQTERQGNGTGAALCVYPLLLV